LLELTVFSQEVYFPFSRFYLKLCHRSSQISRFFHHSHYWIQIFQVHENKFRQRSPYVSQIYSEFSLAIAGAFLIDIKVGIVTWIVAAAHEIPQELGDFGILIHGGWKKKQALIFNFFSALTIVLGGLVAYFLSTKINISFLLPFAAGNFIYIACSDLIPEVKHGCSVKNNIIHFMFFIIGILLIFLVKFINV